MDLALSDEQLQFKQAAREFLTKEVVPYRAEWDRRESVDPAIIGKMGELGFFGLTIPEQYGGLGGDYITYCIGMEELGRRYNEALRYVPADQATDSIHEEEIQ